MLILNIFVVFIGLRIIFKYGKGITYLESKHLAFRSWADLSSQVCVCTLSNVIAIAELGAIAHDSYLINNHM